MIKFKEWLLAKEAMFTSAEDQWTDIHRKGPQAVDQYMKALQQSSPQDVEAFYNFTRQKDLEVQRNQVAQQLQSGKSRGISNPGVAQAQARPQQQVSQKPPQQGPQKLNYKDVARAGGYDF
jgi:uncharacterized protein (DUF1800 family)